MYVKYKALKGTQKRLNEEFKTKCFKSEFEKMCELLNCANYSETVLSHLYGSLSSHAHGGGDYLELRTDDNILSPAEWAAIIALFKCNREKDKFKVFGANGQEIDVFNFIR